MDEKSLSDTGQRSADRWTMGKLRMPACTERHIVNDILEATSKPRQPTLLEQLHARLSHTAYSVALIWNFLYLIWRLSQPRYLR